MASLNRLSFFIAATFVGLAHAAVAKVSNPTERLIASFASSHGAVHRMDPSLWDWESVSRGDSKQIDPAAHRLVALGGKALPALLKHLDDSRETPYVETHGQYFGSLTWGGMSYGDRYPYRYQNPLHRPKGVNSIGAYEPLEYYDVKIGDICYILIGLICNQDMRLVDTRVMGRMIIQSPLHSAALANAVRQDWGDMNESSFKSMLIEQCNRSRRPYGWLNRLLYYAPTEGKALTAKLLRRTPYFRDPFGDLAAKILINSSEQEAKQEYNQGVAKFGQDTMDHLPDTYPINYWIAEDDFTFQSRAQKIIKHVFIGYRPDASYFCPYATVSDQIMILDTSAPYPDPEIDQSVLALFRTVQSMNHSDWRDQDELDELSLACNHRVYSTAQKSVFQTYFQTRLKEMRPSDDYYKKITLAINPGPLSQ